MSSSVIGDAKYQELSMSFTFDEHFQDKLIVNAIVDHTPYQLELLFNPDVDFEDIKNALLAKQFKLLSKSPEILKLKIAFASFEFKNVEKMTLNTLRETIKELSNKLEEKSQRIIVLEDVVKQLRNDFDSITTQMADLRRTNDYNKQQIIQLRKDTIELRQKYDGQSTQNNELTAKIDQYQNELDQIRKQFYEQNLKNQYQDQKISALEMKLQRQGDAIKQQNRKEDEILLKLQKPVDDIRHNQTMKNIQMAHLIQIIFSKLEQIEKVQFTQNHLKQIDNKQQIQVVKSNSIYSFSPLHKNNLINLSDNNSKATNPDQVCSNRCLALVQGDVLKEGSFIRFKIQTVMFYVGVGLALKNLVATNSYELKNYDKIGHGIFLVTNRGFSLSHTKKQENNFKTNFKYEAGDVIRVETIEKGLLYINETKQKEFILMLGLTENEWKECCFCVRLDGSNDSVSIL